MADIQDTWSEYFDRAGQNYTTTSLVLFTDSVRTGCGNATSAVGPFYCPAPGDNQVYLDLGFYDELATRFGAPGDFAQAYVIAHEVGHHIQSLTGISDGVTQARQRDPGNANEYSVRQELQADCLAGVWGYSASNRLTADTGQPILEPGDIEEGLQAAASVGDDRLQAQAGMSVNPETWTHGSSAERVRWFKTGFESGDPEKCDTFAASSL
jgi:predicted metalloprotease